MKTEKPTLMALAECRRDTIDRIIEQGGEVTAADDLALFSSEILMAEKVEAYVAVIDEVESRSARAREIADGAKAYAESCERMAQSIRGRLTDGMVLAHLEKQRTPSGISVSVVAPKPSIVVTNESLVPGDLCDFEVREILKPRKADILKAIQSGREVPGAHVEPGRESIRITKPRAKKSLQESENVPENS